MKKQVLKTPISYYGGKQMMATRIISLFPEHKLYCEPFFGGGAVFFKKTPSKIEIINDLDERVVNFYRVLKTDFYLLKHLIIQTPHSRSVHNKAKIILNNPDLYSKIKRAWAFWVRCNLSFGGTLNAGFSYTKKNNLNTKKLHNKRLSFKRLISKRLDLVQIECNDALQVIKSRDTEESFFYCDPPYFNADMGHYADYSQQDFKNLLDCLSQIKGKFLLSSYDSELLQQYTEKFNWNTLKIETILAITKHKHTKVEVLTSNYKIN